MLYSLVTKRVEDGAWSGVPRFDAMLRRVFPDLRSVVPLSAPAFTAEDVVITDNHLSMLVPDATPTVVVHHGCAQTHYERVASWRTVHTAALCRQQQMMFLRPNRTYVAPSQWVSEEFARHYGLPPGYAIVLPHWVPVIDRQAKVSPRLSVLGDWRDENKGRDLYGAVAVALGREMDIRPLVCDSDDERIAAYRQATHYLCLSASEGGAYAVADAEAAGLTLVSTDVGNAREYGARIVPREVPAAVDALRAARRHHASFFAQYAYATWAERWRQVVAQSREGAPSLCAS